MSFPTCCKAASTPLSLGRSLPQTLLRSKYSTANQLQAGRNFVSARLTNVEGCRASCVSQAFFLFSSARSSDFESALWHPFTRSSSLPPSVPHTTPIYTYLCHRRANLLDPKLTSTPYTASTRRGAGFWKESRRPGTLRDGANALRQTLSRAICL